jgi:hypothetical protein
VGGAARAGAVKTDPPDIVTAATATAAQNCFIFFLPLPRHPCGGALAAKSRRIGAISRQAGKQSRQFVICAVWTAWLNMAFSASVMPVGLLAD